MAALRRRARIRIRNGRSTVDGVVVERLIEPGDMAMPGNPGRRYDEDALRVELLTPEEFARSIGTEPRSTFASKRRAACITRGWANRPGRGSFKPQLWFAHRYPAASTCSPGCSRGRPLPSAARPR